MICKRCNNEIDTRNVNPDGTLTCPYCHTVYYPTRPAAQQPAPQQPVPQQPAMQSGEGTPRRRRSDTASYNNPAPQSAPYPDYRNTAPQSPGYSGQIPQAKAYGPQDQTPYPVQQQRQGPGFFQKFMAWKIGKIPAWIGLTSVVGLLIVALVLGLVIGRVPQYEPFYKLTSAVNRRDVRALFDCFNPETTKYYTSYIDQMQREADATDSIGGTFEFTPLSFEGDDDSGRVRVKVTMRADGQSESHEQSFSVIKVDGRWYIDSSPTSFISF